MIYFLFIYACIGLFLNCNPHRLYSVTVWEVWNQLIISLLQSLCFINILFYIICLHMGCISVIQTLRNHP